MGVIAKYEKGRKGKKKQRPKIGNFSPTSHIVYIICIYIHALSMFTTFIKLSYPIVNIFYLGNLFYPW